MRAAEHPVWQFGISSTPIKNKGLFQTGGQAPPFLRETNPDWANLEAYRAFKYVNI